MKPIIAAIGILWAITAQGQIDSLKLIFAGDIMQHGQQLSAAGPDKNGEYDYSPNYQYIAPIISSADLAIGNLELTLAGPPYMGYPKFCAPDVLASTLQEAGFDVLVTANNHSLDRRKQGLERTIDVLDSLNFPHTGTFKTQIERDSLYPMILQKNNFKLALLNYTYGTNGIPVQKPNVVNLIDTTQIKKDIEKARNDSVDMVIAFLHWGSEYRSLPNSAQKELSRFLFDQEVDMVIGSHPHVLQPVELHKDSVNGDRLVSYSLGNFISNQRTRYRDGGMLLEVNLIKENGRTYIDNAGYHLSWVYKTPPPDMQFYILPAAFYEKDSILVNKESDSADFQQFLKDSRGLFSKFNREVDELKFVKTPAFEDAISPTILAVDPRIDSMRNEKNERDHLRAQNNTFIQIFASSGSPTLETLPDKWKQHLKIKSENGINKYQLGPFDESEVHSHLKEIQAIPEFRGAFIVPPSKN